MDHFMRNLLILVIASSFSFCQELSMRYNIRSVTGTRAGLCPNTQDLVKSIRQDFLLFINNSVLHALETGPGYGGCGCGGPGWRRAAYLNMSDPTQTCPPAWELITTPRRSCARPSNAGTFSCYSAMFPTQSIQYSQVCGRIVGYQKGQPQAFINGHSNDIDGQYVDGVTLTYGSPRQHIWTFASAIDEYSRQPQSKCSCTNVTQQHTNFILSFVGNDYFCETGVPPGQSWNNAIFYADDPLWDGQGCGPTSTCCTFNNPPWFCKQLPQSTNADLEVRLCSVDPPIYENTPVELIELYIK